MAECLIETKLVTRFVNCYASWIVSLVEWVLDQKLSSFVVIVVLSIGWIFSVDGVKKRASILATENNFVLFHIFIEANTDQILVGLVQIRIEVQETIQEVCWCPVQPFFKLLVALLLE